MEVKLLVLGGKHPGQAIPVPGPKFLIGRAEDCQLRPRSELVSRRHCAILAEEGSVKIRDFGSKNGTFVNGEKVTNERELKNGDRLKVGPLEFEVQLAVNVGGKKKPKVHSVQEAAVRTVEAAGDDLDITNWLDEDEETAGGSWGTNKSPLGINSAAQDATGQDDAAPESAEQGAEKPSDTEQKKDDTKVVGRFGSGGKPVADSSRSAAADMLKQFFQRKP
jgi:pSer/pThr/pTyr-binding forkhead associated (FHA) protein